MQPERVALLLAAGFSRRYGSDKRLAGSPPLILRTLATLLPCHDSVLVVLRQRDETLCRLLADSGAELTQVPTGVPALAKGGDAGEVESLEGPWLDDILAGLETLGTLPENTCGGGDR